MRSERIDYEEALKAAVWRGLDRADQPLDMTIRCGAHVTAAVTYRVPGACADCPPGQSAVLLELPKTGSLYTDAGAIIAAIRKRRPA